MGKSLIGNIAIVFSIVLSTGPVAALSSSFDATNGMCASPEQAQQIQEFYNANAGAMPTIAASKLSMPGLSL